MFDMIPMERCGRRGGYNPFREMEEMERAFWNSGNGMNGFFRTDVIDCGDYYCIESELPGFDRENIDVDIQNDCMKITAVRKNESEEENRKYIRKERFCGTFSRSFDVSGISVDQIDASFKDGVLTVTLPKKPEMVPASRKLEIR